MVSTKRSRFPIYHFRKNEFLWKIPSSGIAVQLNVSRTFNHSYIFHFSFPPPCKSPPFFAHHKRPPAAMLQTLFPSSTSPVRESVSPFRILSRRTCLEKRWNELDLFISSHSLTGQSCERKCEMERRLPEFLPSREPVRWVDTMREFSNNYS